MNKKVITLTVMILFASVIQAEDTQPMTNAERMQDILGQSSKHIAKIGSGALLIILGGLCASGGFAGKLMTKEITILNPLTHLNKKQIGIIVALGSSGTLAGYKLITSGWSGLKSMLNEKEDIPYVDDMDQPQVPTEKKSESIDESLRAD